MKTLITTRFDDCMLETLQKITTDYEFAGYGVTGIKMPVEEMKKKIQGVELLISEFEDITKEVIDTADKLKMIVCCRNEAFASVDIEAATAKGIPVLRAAGRNAIAVAEHTIALLMNVSKNMSLTDHLLKYTDELTNVEYNDADGQRTATMSEWSMDPTAPFALYGGGPEMYGKTFGQIGFGMIGKEVAKRANALGMNVIVYDPFVDESVIKEICNGTKVEELADLMKAGDFISVNCNVVPATVGIVSREMINLMKPTAYFVNTARAKVLDYDALYDALVEKRIAGAGLDVYPVEPIPAGNKFLSLRNVVLTPHLAGSARDIVRHQLEITLADVLTWLDGGKPKYICNPEVLK
jgi:D-3-phosphoglycerate dehydrogenase